LATAAKPRPAKRAPAADGPGRIRRGSCSGRRWEAGLGCVSSVFLTPMSRASGGASTKAGWQGAGRGPTWGCEGPCTVPEDDRAQIGSQERARGADPARRAGVRDPMRRRAPTRQRNQVLESHICKSGHRWVTPHQPMCPTSRRPPGCPTGHKGQGARRRRPAAHVRRRVGARRQGLGVQQGRHQVGCSRLGPTPRPTPDARLGAPAVVRRTRARSPQNRPDRCRAVPRLGVSSPQRACRPSGGLTAGPPAERAVCSQ
jgi:hypothetical protein